MSKLIKLLLFFLLLHSGHSNAQSETVFDLNVNSNKGTIIIREIKKCNDLNADSARVHIRIFMPFWKQLKNDKLNPIKIFLIDTTHYSLNDLGFIDRKIKKGWHTVGVDYVFDSSFAPIRQMKLKFKGKREYHFDVYLSAPFYPDKH